MAGTKTTEYGVARGDQILSSLFSDPDRAEVELSYFEDRMREVGLEPDVQVVSVDTTVTQSKPKPYRAPEPVEPEQTGDATED